MGYGWTHSYNVFLYQMRSDMFRMDGSGQVAKYSYGPGGHYTAQPGYFETLTKNPDGSFTITDAQQTVFQFTSIPNTPFMVEGPVYRLVSITDRNQNTTTLSYTNGNLVSITDTYGRSLSLTYTNTNRLWTITDPLGRTNTLQYDSPGHRLLSITDPLGKSVQYAYNTSFQITQKTDRDGRVFFYDYANGKPVAIRDGAGNPVFRLANPQNWAYDLVALASNLVCEFFPATTVKTDGLGHQWQYTYDQNGFITQIIAPDGSTSTYAYDPATLRVAFATNANGFRTAYKYDAHRNRTNVTDALGNVTSYTYEPIFNQMTSLTDPNGRTTTWQYDSRGNRTNEIDPMGFTRAWTYDTHGNALTAKDKNGNVTRYAYDQFGCRTNTTDALTNVTRFTYDAVGNVLSRTDANGHSTTNAYDALNRLVSETTGLTDPSPAPLRQANLWLEVQPLADGTLQFQWDQPGAVLTRTTNLCGPFEDVMAGGQPVSAGPYVVPAPLTNTAEFYRLRADLGLLAALGYAVPGSGAGTGSAGGPAGPGGSPQPKVGSSGDTTTYAYDNEGNRTNVVDCNGNATTDAYDLRKRLVKTTDALGYTVGYAYDNNDNRIAVTNQNSFVTSYDYDVQNRLSLTTDVLNCVSSRTYDGVGNVLTDTDANGHITAYTYDALNRRTASANAIGCVTLAEYATVGGPPCCSPTLGSSLITKMTDGNGKVTYYKYDVLNRLTKVIRKNSDTNDVINPTDAVTTTAYDHVGNVIAVTDPVTNTTVYTFDADNRLTSMVNAAGDTTLTAYDPVGNVRTATAPNLNVTTNTYDARDRLIQVDDKIGRVANYTYDCVGNRLSMTDGNTNTLSYVYDARYRLLTMVDAMAQPTQYTYDPVGNLLRVLDRMTNATLYAYDPLNRRTNTVDALGHASRSEYDCVGNLARLVDANGHPTAYEYDAVNRLTNETYADPPPNTRTFTYDCAGNLLTRTVQKGNSTLYHYSDLYFLTNRSYTSDPSDRFTYDLSGRMLTAERGGWLVTFTYDGANRVIQTVQNGQTISYSYNIPGRTRTVTYPGGRVITEHTDFRTRLAEIDDPGSPTPIVLYIYDLANRVLNRAYRNGAVAAYAYNANDWITNLNHSFGETLIAGFAYGYDNEGNKNFELKRHLPAASEAYVYDSIYRLTNYEVGTLVGNTIPSPAIAKTWNLDPVGNWNNVVSNGVPETRAHDAVNELVAINGQLLAFDDNGNLQQDATYTYAYDEENRLTQVTRNSDSALVGQYQYDALSRRVQRIANPAGVPSTTRYFHDDKRIIEEQDALGVTQATYADGNYIDEVLTMDRGGQTYYYHQNALWSVAALTDSAANPVERSVYDAYGFVTVTDGAFNPIAPNAWGTPHSAIANPYLFTGRQLDEETGIYYYRARYYDTGKGRFLQRDPREYEDGMNLYEYVQSKPVKLLDPSGLCCCDGGCTPPTPGGTCGAWDLTTTQCSDPCSGWSFTWKCSSYVCYTTSYWACSGGKWVPGFQGTKVKGYWCWSP
jgi:RHS repeat-associated protein